MNSCSSRAAAPAIVLALPAFAYPQSKPNAPGLRWRVKFDPTAKYTLNFGVFTGTRFTSGWDNTGWGIAGSQKNLAFKAIYASAIPWTGVEAQYGGLYIIKGESTELTTYDEDGYVIGQRISVKRPTQLYLDEISATVGYLAADPREIPISRRTKYLNDTPNYRHVLVDKKFGTRAGVSTDSPEFLASAFITRAVGNDISLPQRTLSNIVFTYNVIPALKRTGLF